MHRGERSLDAVGCLLDRVGPFDCNAATGRLQDVFGESTSDRAKGGVWRPISGSTQR